MTTTEPQKTRAAIHAGLFIACLVIANAVVPSLAWPWHLLLPLLFYCGIVLLVGPLRRTVPKLSVGRLGGWPLLCALILTPTTTAVLLGFQALVEPDTQELAAKLPVDWLGSLLLAGIVFSIVNAVLEEWIFRGILWELVAEEWNEAAALGVTAALFGVAHLHGYPPGPLGALMAALYGVTLGTLRWWTGGLGLATACHVGADATVYCILIHAGAFPGESQAL